MTLWPAPSTLNKLYRAVGANPAAGSECLLTVPPGKWWQPLAIWVTLAQGATQTPLPILVIDDGTSELFRSPGATTAQSAATTTVYTWAPGLTPGAGGASTSNFGALPLGLLLAAGSRIQTLTTGIGANSDYGIPACQVIEYG